LDRALALAAALFVSGCGGGMSGGRLELALKYVSYRDSNSNPVVSALEAEGNVSGVNALWATCDIQFRIEDYEAVDPSPLDLKFDPREFSELPGIRETFSSPNELLVVTTGPWDRTGTLGSATANAWTAMPAPTGPFGAVLEEKVGEYSALIAHELGHYLGLSHVPDASDVMNAVIYSSSRKLTPNQCQVARATVGSYWALALR
jgi:hypothetical protein